MSLHNKVQLISYPDSLGDGLVELHYVLRKYFRTAVGGVHLLPFYPSSGDRGFAPLTYEAVDPVFGSWDDVHQIGEDVDLIIDFMANHISRESVYFQDYFENGADSAYGDMFLSFNRLSPSGEIDEEELAKVYTRKPRPPYTVIHRADGSREKIWSTFDYDQIDLDWRSAKTRDVMRKHLIRLARTNARMIRLDAVAYTTFKLGTNCFFLEPDIWELLEWIERYVSPFDTLILPEVHEHYSYQLKLAERGYWVYDFALPMLVLHTLYHHTNRRLLDWLRMCPHTQITTLDTHDGIGVVDVEGLMAEEEVEKTVNGLYEKGSNAKRIYSGPDYRNLDIYQINCTYYSALESNDDSYIAARTIQFFTPGIPQVYYVGLLAGENDVERVEQTKNGRDINRHNFTLEEIDSAVQKPVVQRLLKLMEFRNTCAAFDGTFHIGGTAEHELQLSWVNGPFRATADIDLYTYKTTINYFDTEKNEDVEMVV